MRRKYKLIIPDNVVIFCVCALGALVSAGFFFRRLSGGKASFVSPALIRAGAGHVDAACERRASVSPKRAFRRAGLVHLYLALNVLVAKSADRAAVGAGYRLVYLTG